MPLRAQGVRGDLARLARGRPSACAIGAPSSESPERDEDQPQAWFPGPAGPRGRRSADRPAARIASRTGFSASRLPDRIIQAASAPAPSLPKASKVRSTISRGSASPARARSHRFGDAGRRPARRSTWPAPPAARRPSRNGGADWRGSCRSRPRPPSASPPAGPASISSVRAASSAADAALFRAEAFADY